MEKQKKRSSARSAPGGWGWYLGAGISLLMGGACGICIVEYLGAESLQESSVGWLLIRFGILILCVYGVFFLQIILHEGGHLVFGLLSGYRFSSFRIGGILLLLADGRLRVKRLSLAGTGGQCLMCPPDWKNGRIPVVLYNLGGPLMNLIAGVVFLFLAVSWRGNAFVLLIFRLFAVTGICLAATNGIPMRMGAVDNDGCNALAIRQDEEAMRAFWIQLKMNSEVASGVRLRDMPEEWFTLPPEERLSNSMLAMTAVYACNRLLDQGEYARADALMERVMRGDCAAPGLHKSLLACDRIFCELVGENRKDRIEWLLSADQRKFMKSMRAYPSVIRTRYALALLADGDPEKAAAEKAEFERRAKTYPYSSDLESERELIAYADQVWAKRKEKKENGR